MGKFIDEELAQIGKQVRILRICKEMDQEQLADAAKVSSVTISRIENGTSAMNVLTLKRIAEALQVTTEKIVR